MVRNGVANVATKNGNVLCKLDGNSGAKLSRMAGISAAS
jgi:hypothetical protein